MLNPFRSGSVTGTTTATNTAVVNIDTRGCGYQGKTLFLIKNTGATNTIYYQINGYLADPSGTVGIPVAIKAQTSIGTSTLVTSTDTAQPYASVQVLVQNNAGASTYQIDWCTY
jgi:hypothetical protein